MNNVNKENAELHPSGFMEHKVEHHQQRQSWDCGVSCVLMVLPQESRDELLRNMQTVCREEGFGQSTWTIDLSYLLKRYDVKHTMHTTMLGVNEAYKKHGYYDRIIELDRERVQRRFEEAASHGLQVFEDEVNMERLLTHLTQKGPAIVLVDASRLFCDLCKHNKLQSELRRWAGGSGYRGHYVVAVGYRCGRVLYRDPARRPRLCASPLAALAAARAASGTDRDVLLLLLHR